MNAHQQAMSAYRSAAAQVHPLVAVVRLFDVALRSIREAIVAHRDRNFEASFRSINKASQVLRGLYSNVTDSGEVSAALRHAYLSSLLALNAAYGKKDAESRYHSVAIGLLNLRNSWAEIAGMPSANDLVGKVIASASE